MLALEVHTANSTLPPAKDDQRSVRFFTFAWNRCALALAHLASASVPITKTVVKALLTRVRVEEVIMLQYQGRGWCDEMERELNNDIATWRATRF